MPLYGGRLKGQEVTVEFRAGSKSERETIASKLEQAWSVAPISNVETNGIARDRYNEVLDRGLKIIIEKTAEFYQFPKTPDWKTISFHIDSLPAVSVENFSEVLDLLISGTLYSMTVP